MNGHDEEMFASAPSVAREMFDILPCTVEPENVARRYALARNAEGVTVVRLRRSGWLIDLDVRRISEGVHACRPRIEHERDHGATVCSGTFVFNGDSWAPLVAFLEGLGLGLALVVPHYAKGSGQ